MSSGEDYRVLMSTDDFCYGGYGRIGRDPVSAFTPGEKESTVRLYLPARTAVVLCPESLAAETSGADPASGGKTNNNPSI